MSGADANAAPSAAAAAPTGAAAPVAAPAPAAAASTPAAVPAAANVSTAPAVAAPAVAPVAKKQSALTAPEPAPNAPATADAEAKPTEKATAPTGVPEKYEFTLPEGLALDDGLLGATEPILKELGLTQDQAAKLVGAYAEHIKNQNDGLVAKDVEAHNQKIDAWDAELKQTYGDKLPQTLTDAKAVLKHLDSPDLMELLETSGAGSNPRIIGALAKLGSQMRERETVNGGSTPQDSNSWGFANR